MLMTMPATTRVRFGRTKWKCPCCDSTMGEVYGDVVVIKIGGRIISYPVGLQVKQTCAQCGTDSLMPADISAA